MANVEQILLRFLQSKDNLSAKELIQGIMCTEEQISDAEIRQALWSLIDRHEVHLTRERKLIVNKHGKQF
jgi:hypothetical protein